MSGKASPVVLMRPLSAEVLLPMTPARSLRRLSGPQTEGEACACDEGATSPVTTCRYRTNDVSPCWRGPRSRCLVDKCTPLRLTLPSVRPPRHMPLYTTQRSRPRHRDNAPHVGARAPAHRHRVTVCRNQRLRYSWPPPLALMYLLSCSAVALFLPCPAKSCAH